MSDPKEVYLAPTQDAGRALFRRSISGGVFMLNLLWFRPVADYSATPHLTPEQPSAARRLTDAMSSIRCRTCSKPGAS